MASASAESRAQSRTAMPLRPSCTASAVPQLPAPMTAAGPAEDVNGGVMRRRFSCGTRPLPEAVLRPGEEPLHVPVVTPQDERRDARRRRGIDGWIAEYPPAQRQRHARQDGRERDVAKGGHDDDPHDRGGHDGRRSQGEEGPEPRRHAFASLEAEEYRPAVAYDGEQRAGGSPCRIRPEDLRHTNGDESLHDVAQQGQHGGHRAERPQDVGGPDRAAALSPDVDTARGAGDQETHGDGADQVDDDETQHPHGQRSWSLMIARGPALSRNR